MKYPEAERLLETYPLEELLELNDLTEVDVLLFLLKEELIELPETLPIDNAI